MGPLNRTFLVSLVAVAASASHCSSSSSGTSDGGGPSDATAPTDSACPSPRCTSPCDDCLASSCCSQTTACESDSVCMNYVICDGISSNHGGGPLACTAGLSTSPATTAFFELFLCQNNNCATQCNNTTIAWPCSAYSDQASCGVVGCTWH